MIDAFPYDSWDEVEGAFWQYSQGGSGTMTSILAAVGIIITIIALVGWVYMDARMIARHTERLRAAGFGRSTAPQSTDAGPGTPA